VVSGLPYDSLRPGLVWRRGGGKEHRVGVLAEVRGGRWYGGRRRHARRELLGG
jgi:hypothetical protein